MSFAAAAGLWLGLLALPVVGLYVLKIKRHRRTVPYLRLWQELVADQRFTTLFQRLQRLLSLLLQLLILAALVLAFSGLTLSDSWLREDSVVLVVDTGAGMQGLERTGAARSRFAAALERARELVEGRSAEDEFAVIAAGAEPQVLQGFSRSTLRLREALDALRPSWGTADLRAAHRLAGDLLQGKAHPRIVLLADAGGGVPAELAKHEVVRWLPIGESVPNLAILRLQARKNQAVGTDYLLAVVANLGAEPATAELEISLEGVTKKVLPLQLQPGEERAETLELSLTEGGFVEAKLVHPPLPVAEGQPPQPGRDGLAIDDVAHAAVPSARLHRVLLVAADDASIEPFRAAFGAVELIDRAGSRSATPQEWVGMAEKAAAEFDLVVFVNTAPERLPPLGNYLCVNALPGGLPARIRGVEAAPKIRDADPTHPMNRFLEPRDMQPAQAKPLDMSGGVSFLATAGGSIGAVFQESRRKVVYLGVDVLSDAFFLQVAFPLVVRNALAWMHEQQNELLEATYRPGEVVRPRFAIADAAVKVGWRREGTRASGEAVVPVRDGRFYFAATDEPGRYWVETAQGSFRTTVNLFDRGESDLAMPAASGAANDADLERAGFLFGRDLWPLLCLGALGLWLLEWGLYHRRWTE